MFVDGVVFELLSERDKLKNETISDWRVIITLLLSCAVSNGVPAPTTD